MRPQKTNQKTENEELPELTEKQFKFVEGILAGKTASDAYRAAYDCTTMQNATIWATASALRHDRNVAVWLSAARKAGLERCTVTIDGHLAELARIRELALESGNLGAAAQCEISRGKASGHYKEIMDLNINDPLDLLAQIAAVSPELAEKLAEAEGIDWETKH